MTKNEFYTFVKSLQLSDGTYNKEDVYKIGVSFKQDVIKQDRSWSELANYIGWYGTGESLRSFVNNRMKSEGLLAKDGYKPYADYTSQDFDNKMLELQKERQKVRDEHTAYRRLIRETAREEVFVEEIRKTVGDLNAIPSFKPGEIKMDESTHEAILLLSDLHIGVQCDNWYNKYNSNIARERLNKLADDVIKTCKLYNVEVLNVCNLGDMVHGIIHTSARVEEEMNVINQVMVAGELIANLLNKLVSAAPKIVYRSVIDNHSRVIANKEEALDSEHYSKLIDWFLVERLKGTDIIFADDNLDDGVGKFNLLCGKKVMFSHGHNDSINKVYQNFTGMTKEYIDYIFLGHYHSPKAKSFQDTMVFVNGSIVGTEQYAFSKRLFSSPSQTLLVLGVNNGDLINQTIDLSEIK